MTIASRAWHITQYRRVENPYHIVVEVHHTPYRDVINCTINYAPIVPDGAEYLEDLVFNNVIGYALEIYLTLAKHGADVDNTDYLHILDNLENLFAEEGIQK